MLSLKCAMCDSKKQRFLNEQEVGRFLGTLKLLKYMLLGDYV